MPGLSARKWIKLLIMILHGCIKGLCKSHSMTMYLYVWISALLHRQLVGRWGRNLYLYSLMEACPIVIQVKWAHNKLVNPIMSWLGKTAKSLFIFLFFSFSFSLDLQLQGGAWESITWLCHNVTMVWQMVTDGHITRCHMTRVTWGPWENKRIATVAKCISR